MTSAAVASPRLKRISMTCRSRLDSGARDAARFGMPNPGVEFSADVRIIQHLRSFVKGFPLLSPRLEIGDRPLDHLVTPPTYSGEGRMDHDVRNDANAVRARVVRIVHTQSGEHR